MTSFAEQPAGTFLDRLAAREPAPGGGGAAAVAGAMAAGLVAMAARFSADRLTDADELAARADRFRRRAADLVDEDARAYQAFLDASRRPDGSGRRDRVLAALRAAALTPLEIAEIAAEVAGMTVRVAREGNPRLKGDTVAAALLAEASARCAARLVVINVEQGAPGADLSSRASDSVAAAQAAARQAEAA